MSISWNINRPRSQDRRICITRNGLAACSPRYKLVDVIQMRQALVQCVRSTFVQNNDAENLGFGTCLGTMLLMVASLMIASPVPR